MIIFASSSFYYVSAGLCIICLIYILFVALIIPSLEIKKVKKSLNNFFVTNSINYSLTKDKNINCTFKLVLNEKEYNVQVLRIKKNCDLQINNIDTFVMYYPFLADNKIKSIDGLTNFMNSKEPNRIIILSKKAKTIKKVINECEMIMVNENTNVYGVNILNFNSYDYFLNKK